MTGAADARGAPSLARVALACMVAGGLAFAIAVIAPAIDVTSDDAIVVAMANAGRWTP